jgi:hypothetical protein
MQLWQATVAVHRRRDLRVRPSSTEVTVAFRETSKTHTRSVRISDVSVDLDHETPCDAVFQDLFVRAQLGHQPVYFGQVPIELIDAFDPDFHPEETPLGREMTAGCLAASLRGDLEGIWVYPRDGRYVSSDDYLPLAAVRLAQAAGLAEYVPCYVLGDLPLPGVLDVQGPIDATSSE